MPAENASESAGFSKPTSLVVKISFFYLILTFLNVLIFWAAVGANQMHLIRNNALLASKSAAEAVIGKLRYLLQDARWTTALSGTGAEKTAAAKLLRRELEAGRGDPPFPKFEFISAAGERISDAAAGTAPPELGKDINGKTLAALQLKEQKNQSYYGTLNLANYSVELFVPIDPSGISDLVFFTEIPVTSIRAELRSLLVLGLSMIGLLLLVQSLFGIALYRMLVVPIRGLLRGARQISEGNFKVAVPLGRRTDELGQLIFFFNQMAFALDEKTRRLETALKNLQKFKLTMTNELIMAQRIQQSLLPSDDVSNLIEASCFFSPLEKVSGDFYDIFQLPDGSVGILLIDVSGHGVPAALITIMAKIRFSTQAAEFVHPRDLLKHVNEEICKDITTGEYVTAFYLVIHPDRRIEYCNAGHQRAILVRGRDRRIEELDSDGLFLGIGTDRDFPQNTGQLEAHDRIILFTDGIVERTNADKEAYGVERFKAQIEKNSHLALADFSRSLREDVEKFAGGLHQNDDITMLAIEIKPGNVEVSSGVKQAGQSALIDAIEVLRRRDFPLAKMLFEDLIKSESSNKLVRFYLAVTMLYGRNYAGAASRFEELNLETHGNPYIHLHLGICYFRMNLIDEAIAEYEKAVAMNGKIADIYYYLSFAHMRKGNLPETATYADLGLTLAPENRKLRLLKRQIHGLGPAGTVRQAS